MRIKINILWSVCMFNWICTLHLRMLLDVQLHLDVLSKETFTLLLEVCVYAFLGHIEHLR